MCGIVGYTGKKEAKSYLIEGLKALEYRGYDSAGLAVVQGNGLCIVRTVGKVVTLEAETEKYLMTGTSGISHTRWATHGKPTAANSHPHSGCGADIAVVHNGIIENYLEIKNELILKGHLFKSETDTEVIAHLLEENLKIDNNISENTLLKAVRDTFARLNGSYAVAVLWSKLPDVIIGTRKKSPLIAGAGKDENFIGSDISAFQSHTDKAIYLDDGDIVLVNQKEIKLFDANLNSKKYATVTLASCGEACGKNGFEHYMLKEITEQPATIRATVEAVIGDLSGAFGIDEKELKHIKNIMMVGCGTAYHATMTAKYWFEEFCNLPTQAELASEYKYRTVAMPKETLAIFVSQSGETADTLAALEKAKQAGFRTLAICNVGGSTITREADSFFLTKCGREISVASTKAFTAQLATLFALAILVGKANNNIDEKQARNLLDELADIPDQVLYALNTGNEVKKLAEKYHNQKSFIFLGRNANYPIALEGALKLKEITYLHAEGFAAGEIKHGPIALIDENMPVIALMNGDGLFEKMVSSCQEVMARGANPIAITDKHGDEIGSGKLKEKIVLENTPSYLSPMVNVVVLQLFAYWVARFNNREIDQPRNLAKSVTVE